MGNSIRIDKWLWTVRLFKTRSQATEACKSGKIYVDSKIVKPSKEVNPGDEISLKYNQFVKTVKVIGILKNRVSAKIAAQNIQDLTPEEEYKKRDMINVSNYEYRDRGAGRPTKKDRRNISQLKRDEF